jgi:hypothetical protein
MDLAHATGALVALSVEMAGQGIVIDVLPGTRRLPQGTRTESHGTDRPGASSLESGREQALPDGASGQAS